MNETLLDTQRLAARRSLLHHGRGKKELTNIYFEAAQNQEF